MPELLWPASATQALAAVEPVVMPVPLLALHFVHCVSESVLALNVPESQFTQFAPLASFSPGPQTVTQSDLAFEAMPVVVLPATHSVHTIEETEEVLNVPATQAVTLEPKPV